VTSKRVLTNNAESVVAWATLIVMKKLWNTLLIMVSLLVLAGSVKALLHYWQYDDVAPDVAKMMLHQVNAEDVRASIREAIAQDNPSDVRMYLQLAKTFGYAIDPAEFAADLQRLESPLNVAKRSVNDFTTGFIQGQAESGAGVAGAVTSDFTVVGDVRDLWEQYQLYTEGKPVNELVVTLAGVGVGLTAATLASSGAASPAKTGVSTTKLAAKGNHLSPAFQTFLLKQGADVFDYKTFMLAARAESSLDGVSKAAVKAYHPQALKSLQQTAEQVNNIRKSSSTVDALQALKYVDNTDDLARLEKLTMKYGTETKGVLKLLGKGVIASVRVLRKSAELLISLVATTLSFIGSLLSFGRIILRR
jgi:hypothetical protein